MNLEDINKKIAESGYMQMHIAKKLGVTKEYLNRLLRGKRTMPESIKLKLEYFLK